MQSGLEAHQEDRDAAMEVGLEPEATIMQEQGWDYRKRPLLFLDLNPVLTGASPMAM